MPREFLQCDNIGLRSRATVRAVTRKECTVTDEMPEHIDVAADQELHGPAGHRLRGETCPAAPPGGDERSEEGAGSIVTNQSVIEPAFQGVSTACGCSGTRRSFPPLPRTSSSFSPELVLKSPTRSRQSSPTRMLP